MREFSAVNQNVFHCKLYIATYTKWMTFSFESIRMGTDWPGQTSRP